MRQKKKEVAFYLITVLSCLFAMTVVVIAALLIYDKVKENSKQPAQEVMGDVEEITYSQEDVDRMLAETIRSIEDQTKTQVSTEILTKIENGLSQGETVVATLRPLYPNNILVVSNGAFHFVPIRDDFKKHSLKQANINVLETGEMQYIEEGQVVSHKGIDVSKFQGKIDWNKVAADGVEYAFIRLGIRGYGSEGKIVLDDMFHQNVKGAQAAGIKVGVYFFAQAITEAEALEEAEFVLEEISSYKLDYPIVYDVEKVNSSSGRMNQLSVEERTNVTLTFLNKIKDAGYTPMIYANMEMLSVLIDMESLEGFDKWFAYYDTSLYFPYEYAVWQYSEKGKVDGIDTNVDMNISFKEW